MDLQSGPDQKAAVNDDQARRAHRLDAVSELAGGLAHDFNNLLTIILGYCNTLDEQFDDDDERRLDLEQIRHAGERAAHMTRQLLAFSGKQMLRPGVLDPNESILGRQATFAALLGDRVTLVINCDPGVRPVHVDRIQLELALTNLVTNARDAMPQGGRCTIETANVDRDGATSVRISVTDTGVGIDAATRSRIFEPFYTTKARGKGPGLGLATAFGIVKQSGGSLEVQSEPGRGATFTIHLPAATGAAAARQPASREMPKGTETVLVVEDQADVRLLVQTVLKRAGYTVVAATTPADAIRVVSDPRQPVDLVVSDVMMPDTNGAALVARLREARPGLPALFMSGFTADVIAANGVLPPGMPFLQKPFTGIDLACLVRDVLDRDRDHRTRPSGTAASSPA